MRQRIILGLVAVLVSLPSLPYLAADSPAAPSRESPGTDGDDKRKPKEVIRESTGITFSVLASLLRRRIIRTRTPYGFAIKRVAKDSPAAKAGLKRGDVVLEWDGKPLRKTSELARWIQALPCDAQVKLRYARRKRPIRLGSRKPWETREAVIKISSLTRRR